MGGMIFGPVRTVAEPTKTPVFKRGTSIVFANDAAQELAKGRINGRPVAELAMEDTFILQGSVVGGRG